MKKVFKSGNVELIPRSKLSAELIYKFRASDQRIDIWAEDIKHLAAVCAMFLEEEKKSYAKKKTKA